MDDEYVSWVNFRQLDIFGQEVALEAKWACDVIRLNVIQVVLNDAIFSGN